MAHRNFRILSLDGGGTWALIQVKALMAMYGSLSGHEVLRQFDLAVANSGGSLVLGGLAANFSLSRILELFDSEADRDSIFVKSGFLRHPFAWVSHRIGLDAGPQYSTVGKFAGLRRQLSSLGDRSLADMPDEIGNNYRGRAVKLAICGFDYDSNREVFFRSDRQSLAASRGTHPDATLAQAIHASANPPVNYFDAPAEFAGRRYWDGAVGGYNNPVLAGVIEALSNRARYGVNGNAIAALSIGTGSVALLPAGAAADSMFVARRRRSCFINDAKKMAESILDDPPDAASFHAHIALGGALPEDERAIGGGPVVRMSPLIQPVCTDGKWRCPPGIDADRFRALVDLPMDAVGAGDVELIHVLCESWLAGHASNQPIRANGATLAPEIGHRTFSAAQAAWRKLCEA